MIRLWVDAVHVCSSDDIKLSSYPMFGYFCAFLWLVTAHYKISLQCIFAALHIII